MEIQLQRSIVAIVDNEDFERVNALHWYAVRDGNYWYAKHTRSNPKRTISMHRMILGFPPFAIDHINRNGLDNRKANLRPTDKSRNALNGAMHLDHKHGKFKGVTFDKSLSTRRKWRASITINGKRQDLGRFETAEQANKAYLKASVEIGSLFLSGQMSG